MGQETAEEPPWTLTIRPTRGWFDLRLGQLWRYRDLILLFVRRDFVAVYKQTILGPLWFLAQPLLTTLVFTVVFGKVADLPTDGQAPILFYMAGVVCWRYFSTCLTKTSHTFVGHAHLFGKVYFPRLSIPIASVIGNLLSFAIQFLLFIGFYVWYASQGAASAPSAALLLLPLLILQMAALGLGLGIIVASLTTRYRDLAHLVGFGAQLWMYATPIVYPASMVPAAWRWILVLNPMASVVELFRYALLGKGSLDPWAISASIGSTLLVLLVGVLLFNHVEKSFTDTI